MSSLWTPSGEHEVDRGPGEPPRSGPRSGAEAPGERNDEEMAAAEADVEALRDQLARTPPETVIANHCYGLFELGAIYLSSNPPQLAAAHLAIDAFGYLVEGLGDRLGEAAVPLRDALAQIRLGFVQVQAALRAAEEAASAPDGQPGP